MFTYVEFIAELSNTGHVRTDFQLSVIDAALYQNTFYDR